MVRRGEAEKRGGVEERRVHDKRPRQAFLLVSTTSPKAVLVPRRGVASRVCKA